MNRTTRILLGVGACVIGGAVAADLAIAAKGHSARTTINEILAGGYPVFQLFFGLWELHKRRLGKLTGIGRTIWDKDKDTLPLPGRFLRLSLLQTVLVPLGLALPAGLRLGMPWPLLPLATSALLMIAFALNFHHEIELGM